MNITVLIGTYGDHAWRDLAMSRAVPSALRASTHRVSILPVHEPDGTLASARNHAASQARSRWLCFLDADDELGPGYLDAMTRAIDVNSRRDALYVPMVQYVRGRRAYAPRFPAEVPIEDGNWLVIGTVIPASAFKRVGGFEEWPLYEDWALFARIQKLGIVPVRVPSATYIAHRRNGSRNHPTGGKRVKLAAHDSIRRAVFPELYEEVA